MASTLTERYIAATVRSLPADAQEDVRAELTASIADDIEARLEHGESRAEAEHAVITGLGDPDRLAAGYADRPLRLIGPKYYLTWWRLLKLLWMIVPPIAVAGVTVANLIADAPVGEIIGSVVSTGIGTVVHVAFWTTIVFAVLERTGADTGVTWTPDQLPEPQDPATGRSDLIGSLVFLSLTVAALVWDRFVGFAFFRDGAVDVGVGLGEQTRAVSVLNPELWPWWLGGMFVLIAAEAALAIAIYRNRGWTSRFAAFNTLLAVAFTVGALYLLQARELLNPEFLDLTLGRDDVPGDVGRTLAIITAVGIVGVSGWDAIDGWRKARNHRRG